MRLTPACTSASLNRMFPIRDHNPSGRRPYITTTLIVINVLVFLATKALFSDDAALGQLYHDWAMIPARLSEGGGYYTLISSMFLHGGWMHLGGNMLFLWVFGDNLEDELGHVGFLILYLAFGVLASVAQIAAGPFSPIPVIGASGAIAGVMGGYLLLFPRARVDVLFIFVIIFKIFPIPAWIVLSVWLAIQIFSGIGADASAGGGVAYWAHAGGFLAGFVLMLPVWLHKGGTAFWRKNHGQPPHPEASYRLSRSNIPKAGRNR